MADVPNSGERLSILIEVHGAVRRKARRGSDLLSVDHEMEEEFHFPFSILDLSLVIAKELRPLP